MSAGSPSGRWRGFSYLGSTIVKETASSNEKREPKFALLIISVALIVFTIKAPVAKYMLVIFVKGKR